jgi:thymidylate kinase
MWPFKKKVVIEKIEEVDEPEIVIPIEVQIEKALNRVSRVGEYIILKSDNYTTNAFLRKNDVFLHLKVTDYYSGSCSLYSRGDIIMYITGSIEVAEAVLFKIISLLNE